MFFAHKNVSRATNHNQITYLAKKIKACTWYIAKIGYPTGKETIYRIKWNL